MSGLNVLAVCGKSQNHLVSNWSLTGERQASKHRATTAKKDRKQPERSGVEGDFLDIYIWDDIVVNFQNSS